MTLYQPFLDYALTQLEQSLNLSPYPIPDGFTQKQGTMGKGQRQEDVITTSYGFKADKLRQIRAAHVQGGAALQVLNFVIFPELAYDLPFFGADLVTLPGGHLIALDMQPLFHHQAYQDRYTKPLLPVFHQYQQQLPWGGDFPEEAKPFFSPCFLWTRPQETEKVETLVFEAFKAYLQVYLQFVDQAEPVQDANRQHEILQAHRCYAQYRAAKDPARGMFTRLYGSEWTEEYIHGFLFDLERQLAATC
ncbi:MAG: phycoerythrobilin:ferredoxin oxidoreductase [Oscillatoriales cyanobacterium RM1_1_9]|nr:phycoerythrobilin:ferredoxin oxidoreductase [Oscillatoriales cyanobacterium SM2_3_0]NJO47847.1 phycoerythrobilin:ferredoxin oxidoreductase [Oscillatoriales cyanobacterium RM2_1_1]NJO70794.1 phycoerythrobilin:ferredoxin oxidoreductase [Oscillatoriales cyanobacterium RM1_1_9]